MVKKKGSDTNQEGLPLLVFTPLSSISLELNKDKWMK